MEIERYYITIALAILLVLVTFLVFRRFRRAADVVLLVGLSDSGKTAIFSKLIFNKAKKSVTSLKENEASIDDFNLRIIDLPGAERLRSRYWEQYRDKARHVVFVLDSSTIDSKLRDLSEYLYSLLANSIVHQNKIIFTVACNKQDLDGVKRKDEIKAVLEKELEAIRNTKRGQLGKTSEEEEEDFLASLAGRELSLDELRVYFIETSLNNMDQLIKRMLSSPHTM